MTMIDVTGQLNAVRRTVGSRVLEAGTVRIVTVSQSYEGTVEDVWDACTNPARIPRWFVPISGELRLGGHYQLEGNAGGVVTRCDPPESFAATWEFGGAMSWIELRLTALSDSRTRFELDHIAPDDDEKWAQFGPGAVGVGWDLILLGLALYLSTGKSLDPDEVGAWLASAEGRALMTDSSNAWYDANVAAGTAAEVARIAADQTLAAYTGG
jgi:uncharacterized protein YndB with AHSA1/START domain